MRNCLPAFCVALAKLSSTAAFPLFLAAVVAKYQRCNMSFIPRLCMCRLPQRVPGVTHAEGSRRGCYVRCPGGSYAGVLLSALTRLLADCEADMPPLPPPPLALPLAFPTTAVLATRCKGGNGLPAAAASRKALSELLNSPLLRARRDSTLIGEVSLFGSSEGRCPCSRPWCVT